MKLNEINDIDIIAEQDGYVVYLEQLSESSMKVGLGQSKGGFVSKALQGAGKIVKNNPFLVGALAAYSVDALKQYNKNKRKTITFYTKDVQENKMYKDIVKTLMSTGKYRKIKDTYVDSGYLIQLKKLS